MTSAVADKASRTHFHIGVSKLVKYLGYQQEVHGHARWLTTASGYLRIYGALSGTDSLSLIQVNNLMLICEFIVSVYTPAWFYIHHNPGVPEGSSIMLRNQDYILDGNEFYGFRPETMKRLNHIFVPHGTAWLGNENVALAVLSNTNFLTMEKTSSVFTTLSDDDIKLMLWNKSFKLEDFVTSETRSAPCLTDKNIDWEFWSPAMNHNRSCERYVGRAKNVLENKQLRDNENIDMRVASMVNLQLQDKDREH